MKQHEDTQNNPGDGKHRLDYRISVICETSEVLRLRGILCGPGLWRPVVEESRPIEHSIEKNLGKKV